MNERWTQIRQLFRAALELESSERDRYLESASPDDPALRDRVAAMLAAFEENEEDAFLEKPAAEVKPLMTDASDSSRLVGATIGPYRIKRAIAQGGMGVVFEALDTKLDKVVALKMMNPAMAQDATFRQRFELEAKTLARLEDPRFVRVYAVVEEGPNAFIVMEYVDGVTLAGHLRKNGLLAPRDAAAIGIQLLRALSKAHRQGIVHRDLKPGNIMLTRNDEGRVLVKVLDFGIAKQVRPDGSQTRTMGAVGTLFYMSPEQARGLRTIDHRTDLYSLAVTLYEAISGELPFDINGDEFTLRKRIVEGQVTPLDQRKPDVPASFSRVIMKALSASPEARYQTADAMREALQAAIQEELAPSPDRPAAALQPPTTPQKTAWKIPSLVAAVLVLAAAGFFAIRQATLQTPEPASLELAAMDSSRDGASTLDLTPPADSMPGAIDDAAAADSERTGETESEPRRPAPAETSAAPLPESRPVDSERNPVDLETPPSNDVGVDTLDALNISITEGSATDTMTLAEQASVEPAALSFIEFRVSPSGDVYIDDQLRLERAILNTIGLPAGSYPIRIEHKDFGRWVCDLEVGGEETVVRVEFDKPVSVVVVAVDDASGAVLEGSSIIIDGEATPYTTPMTVRLAPGLHRIEARREGYAMVAAEPDAPNGCYRRVDGSINLDADAMDGRGRILVRLRAAG